MVSACSTFDKPNSIYLLNTNLYRYFYTYSHNFSDFMYKICLLQNTYNHLDVMGNICKCNKTFLDCSQLILLLTRRLATIDINEQFSKPVQQTLKGPANTRSRISRCTVCLRKPPDRIIPFVL